MFVWDVSQNVTWKTYGQVTMWKGINWMQRPREVVRSGLNITSCKVHCKSCVLDRESQPY